MPKKLIATLGVFFFALFIFIFVNTMGDKNPANYSLFHKKLSPTPTLSMASISILPNPPIVLSGQIGAVDIVLETNTTPTIAQLELSYNPQAMSIVSIIPGSYFKNPTVLLKKIDTNSGRISYALRADATSSDSKNLVTIYFSALASGEETETKFSFLPKTSLKSTEGDILLKAMNSSSVILKPSLPLPIASPSGAVR